MKTARKRVPHVCKQLTFTSTAQLRIEHVLTHRVSTNENSTFTSTAYLRAPNIYTDPYWPTMKCCRTRLPTLIYHIVFLLTHIYNAEYTNSYISALSRLTTIRTNLITMTDRCADTTEQVYKHNSGKSIEANKCIYCVVEITGMTTTDRKRMLDVPLSCKLEGLFVNNNVRRIATM